ncbi:MAG: ThiF family adenylyltransferase, partial [Clostridia bacterium]
MFDCFSKNIGTLTTTEADALQNSTIAVVGVGGLGGRVSENLCRNGVGKLILIDDDNFSTSNLNRQLFCNCETIGLKKAEVAKTELQKINQDISIDVKTTKLDEKNACEFLVGASVVVDALDNIPSRLVLENACATLGIPLIHGAVSGFCGEVAIDFPQNLTLSKLYRENSENPSSSVLSSTCAVIAAVQSTVAVKVILGKISEKDDNLYLIDL